MDSTPEPRDDDWDLPPDDTEDDEPEPESTEPEEPAELEEPPYLRAVPDPPDDSLPSIPHDDDLERAILAQLLLHEDLPDLGLSVEHFYRRPHRLIFRALDEIRASGDPVDVLTLKTALKRRGDLQAAGGPVALARLFATHAKTSNVTVYAAALRQIARNRWLVKDASRLQDAALSGKPADAIVRRIQEALAGDIEPLPARTTDLASADATYPEWIVRDFLPRSGLVLFWARPSAGKTYLLLRASYELLSEPQPQALWGHPDLAIPATVKRVLWIATEETAGRLKARALAVLRGLEDPHISGDLVHIFASDPAAPVTLLDLPELMERHAPVDIVILDSLTGLRPKTIDGRRVSWDVDNDAANALCLMLRGVAEQYKTCLVMVHHTGRVDRQGEKDTYRGPTEYWASADVQVGLIPDPLTGTVKVKPEKNRDGRRLPIFRLRPEWLPEGFFVTYEGNVVVDAEEHRSAILDALREAESGMLSQTQIIRRTGIPRSTVQRSLKELADLGLVRDTGNQAARSPIFEALEGRNYKNGVGTSRDLSAQAPTDDIPF